MRIASNMLWIIIPLVVLLLALLQALSPAVGNLQAAELSTPDARTATYVNSDPSVPPASSVEFADTTPAPVIETF
jgi:hypothetical protein